MPKRNGSDDAARRPVGLKLNGKPWSFTPPAAARIVAFLSSQPADEIFTARDLAGRCECSETVLWRAGCAGLLNGLVCRIGKRNLYGSPAAIEELERQYEAQRNSSAAD